MFSLEPPNAESRPGGVRGPMLMPAFDPTKARAQLKHSKANVGVSHYEYGGDIGCGVYGRISYYIVPLPK